MPSYARQGVTVFRNKNKNTGKYLMTIKKTGYANIWVGNRHIYWDYTKENVDPRQIDFNKIVQQYNQTNQKQKNRVIIVRRG